MRIAYNSIWLAPGGLNGARDVSFNDQLLVQQVQLPRAIATIFLARGNRSADFSFTAARFFDTAADCEQFMLTHRNGLPDTAPLLVGCGGEGEASIYVQLPDAVLQTVTYAAGQLKGRSLLVTYRFVGGLFGGIYVPPDPSDSETTYYPDWGLTVKKGIITLTVADVGKTVAFDAPMPSDPVVTPVIIAPLGGDSVACWLDGAPTSTGFKVVFAAPIPATGYKLSWIAFA